MVRQTISSYPPSTLPMPPAIQVSKNTASPSWYHRAEYQRGVVRKLYAMDMGSSLVGSTLPRKIDLYSLSVDVDLSVATRWASSWFMTQFMRSLLGPVRSEEHTSALQ